MNNEGTSSGDIVSDYMNNGWEREEYLKNTEI